MKVLFKRNMKPYLLFTIRKTLLKWCLINKFDGFNVIIY